MEFICTITKVLNRNHRLLYYKLTAEKRSNKRNYSRCFINKSYYKQQLITIANFLSYEEITYKTEILDYM